MKEGLKTSDCENKLIGKSVYWGDKSSGERGNYLITIGVAPCWPLE